jgi:hypothetical protein
MEGLDINEHGNIAYPDFVSASGRGIISTGGGMAASMAEAPAGYRASELSKGYGA